MTDTAALTDEELAQWESALRVGVRVSMASGFALRLIAALRASRAEVELYVEEVKAERSAANTLRVRNGELRAEVERLRRESRTMELRALSAEGIAGLS